jgi:hypothetical protein
MSSTRIATLLGFILFLRLAATGAASPPDPANCEVPDHITLVARGPSGGADPLGIFGVVVKDFNNVPELDYDVVIDFSSCPDLRICADQSDPNVVVDCVAHTLSAPQDQNGRATFRVLGFATNTGASPGSIGPCVEVFAGGVFLGSVRVAAFDQNGITGVDGQDLSLFLKDYFSGQSFARSDYDGSGTLDGNDLSLWLAAFFAGGSSTSGGAACP